MKLKQVKERASDRLSALELLLEEPDQESCRACLLGNALTLKVLGHTCEQEAGEPEACKPMLEIAEGIEKQSKTPKDILLDVKTLKCGLLSENPEEKKACNAYVSQVAPELPEEIPKTLNLGFVVAGILAITI